MAQQTSRRSFLGLSALGLAAAVSPADRVRTAVAASQPENERSNIHPNISVLPSISVWLTSGDERFAAAAKVTCVQLRRRPAPINSG